jgi:serine/threonine-protein kinase
MATVYLAEDLKHRRKVAVKVLREDLSASVGAPRFLREIEIAAQLQHPNILPLLDSGEAGGLLYYVMPYVEGQSLRHRLARERELPIHEAVRLTFEIVDALAHAHHRGVVHRDIKPDNVMLSGRHALVTDFGVAKAVSEATGGNTLTSMGVALGTPTYMAPEQAVADPHTDHRADIYAVGVVAYELLAGRTPFTGVTPQQMLAMHVTEKAEPLSKHRPGVSPVLEQTIMRCLEKLPADRWQSADELLAALEPLATPSGGTMPTAARLEAVAPRRKSWLVPGLALAGVAVAVVAWSVLGGRSATLALGRSTAVTSDPGLEVHPAISPDGKFVAFAAGNAHQLRIFVRPVGGGRAIPLTEDSTVQAFPHWSPDGTQLLLRSGTGIAVAPAFGGAGSARPVVPGQGFGVVSADWSPDGREVLFVRNDSVQVAALGGGAPRLLAVGSALNGCSWPAEGRWIACVSGNAAYNQPGNAFGNLAPSALVLIPVAGGTPVEVVPPTSLNHSPVWAPDGRSLLFVSDRDGPRDIYEQSIGSSGQPVGVPRRLTTGLGAQSISLSADGKQMAYSVYQARSNIWSLPVPQGAPVGIEGAVQLTAGNQVIEVPAISADGRWVYYDSNIKGNSDIWRVPVGGGTPEQLTSEPFDEFAANPSPDGRSIAYHALRTPGIRQIEVKPLDGGPVEMVTSDSAQWSNPQWSEDGTRISFVDIVNLRLAWAERTGAGRWSAPRILGFGALGFWSPDGKQVLTLTDLAPPAGPYGIVTFPADSGALTPVYVPGPGDPPFEGIQWADGGRTVYFKSHDQLGRASIWSIPTSGGKPRLRVRFDDLNRPSDRPGFATNGKTFWFTIEDRQSDVFVAELLRK